MPPKRKVVESKKASKDNSEAHDVVEDVGGVGPAKMGRGRPKKNESAKPKKVESMEPAEPRTRGRKAAAAASKDVKEEEDEDEAEETKVVPVKKQELKAVKHKKQEAETVKDNKQETEEVKVVEDKKQKKTRKETTKEVKGDIVTKKNATDTTYENIDFAASENNSRGEAPNVKIASWNIGGLRAWIKKDGLQYITNEGPDVICLQETKCSEKKLPEEFGGLSVENGGSYHMYWLDGETEGYAGVGLLTRTKPTQVTFGINSPPHDTESRCITAHFPDYHLINAYVPNSGRGLKTLPQRLDWNSAFLAYLKQLDQDKPIIVCGDLNVAHKEIDLRNPKTNGKTAGFTPEEREGMTHLLKEVGLVDVFRRLYPEEGEEGYTFWSYMGGSRAKNVGWRLDYFLVSERFMENVCDTKVRNQVFGSDHCPLTLHFNCDNM